MATHSRILAWRIPQTEERSGLQSWGCRRVEHSLATEHMHVGVYRFSRILWLFLKCYMLIKIIKYRDASSVIYLPKV